MLPVGGCGSQRCGSDLNTLSGRRLPVLALSGDDEGGRGACGGWAACGVEWASSAPVGLECSPALWDAAALQGAAPALLVEALALPAAAAAAGAAAAGAAGMTAARGGVCGERGGMRAVVALGSAALSLDALMNPDPRTDWLGGAHAAAAAAAAAALARQPLPQQSQPQSQSQKLKQLHPPALAARGAGCGTGWCGRAPLPCCSSS